MKKIGIVGGIAWLSTADYYTGICRRSEQWHLARNPQAGSSTPEMSIESLDVSKAVSYIGTDGDEKSWSDMTNIIARRCSGRKRAAPILPLLPATALTIASRPSCVELGFPS